MVATELSVGVDSLANPVVGVGLGVGGGCDVALPGTDDSARQL